MSGTVWEYRVEHIQQDLQAALDRLGGEGWELVSGEKYRFVFKRPAGGA